MKFEAQNLHNFRLQILEERLCSGEELSGELFGVDGGGSL